MPPEREIYCTLFGSVRVKVTDTKAGYPIEVSTKSGDDAILTENGLWHANRGGECIIFPSKTNRNWNLWHEALLRVGDFVRIEGRTFQLDDLNMLNSLGEVERWASAEEAADQLARFCPVTYLQRKPRHHELVLARLADGAPWRSNIFSHMNDNEQMPFGCAIGDYPQCVPYKGNEGIEGTSNPPRVAYFSPNRPWLWPIMPPKKESQKK